MIQIVERKPQGKHVAEKLEEVIELMKNIMDTKMASNYPEVMTAKDVQEFLQISNMTFYNLKNSGQIQTVDLGGTKRYLKSQILKMLLDHLN